MRILKSLIVALLLVLPGLALAGIKELPGDTTWYLHVDFDAMRKAEAGSGVYDWMVDEVFDDLRDEAGVDLEKELSSLTGYSMQGQGPAFAATSCVLLL